jgi:F-type H+-transporting ATPase subunit gamma
MSSTREIKQRIKNIESVEQLVRAMYMVASTQLRRSNKALTGVIPIVESLRRKMDELASIADVRNLPYYEERPVYNSLYLVFTGDRGLAGAYNSRVEKFAIEKMKGKREKIVAIGSYGNRFFQRNEKNVIHGISRLPDSKVYRESREIAELLVKSFLEGESDEVFLVYTEFENILTSEPKIERILPLRLKKAKWNDEIFEPGLKPYVDNLVLFYMHMTIFRAFAEAKTSERASRMLAMDTAGTNARDLVEELQRKLNRQRQQEITQELAEIVGQRQ